MIRALREADDRTHAGRLVRRVANGGLGRARQHQVTLDVVDGAKHLERSNAIDRPAGTRDGNHDTPSHERYGPRSMVG